MSADQQEEELTQQMEDTSVSEQPSDGPKRASRSNRTARPPTAFALAPINPLSAPKPSVSEPAEGGFDESGDDQPTDDSQQEAEEDQPSTPEESTPAEEESPAPAPGPTRAKNSSMSRPPTTFVSAPITGGPGLPGSPFPGRGPADSDSGPQRATAGISRPGTTFVRGGAARGAPGSPARGGRSPSPGGSPVGSPSPREQLIEQEKADARKCVSLKVNTNDLLQYSTAEEIFSRSSVYSTLSSKVENLHVMEQLFVCLSNPKQCTLFNSVSSGLGEQRVQELHNKMKCVAIQLITTVHNPKVTGMIFRHNLLDRFYVELLTSPAPLNELSTHYLREVLNHLLKNHKETVLDYLASPVPGKSGGTRAQLLLAHFYAENITYLFDELLTAEETYSQQQQAAGGSSGAPARGGRGGPSRGSPGSAARGRGGPRGRGGRGGPGGPRGRGAAPGARGGARGAPGGRGAPTRGRGGAPAGGRSGPNYRFSRTFDLHKELKKQFFGGDESGSDKMILVRAQNRIVNTAHVYQGLLFRGWDMPTITAILKDVGSYADQIVDNQWRGVEVAEYQVKVLVALLKFMNKHWNPSTPRGETIAESADTLIRDRLCKGSFRKALDAHPASTLPKLKILSNGQNCTLGGLRLQILYFASFIPLVRFLDRYEQVYIESGIIKRALDLFFEYSHHFFLHETVARSLLTNVIKCKSDTLVAHVFVDCKLLERIMDNFQPFSKSRSKDATSYVSYSGHLLYLANLIRDSKVLTQRAGLSSKLSCISRWDTFLASEVRTENQL